MWWWGVGGSVGARGGRPAPLPPLASNLGQLGVRRHDGGLQVRAGGAWGGRGRGFVCGSRSALSPFPSTLSLSLSHRLASPGTPRPHPSTLWRAQTGAGACAGPAAAAAPRARARRRPCARARGRHRRPPATHAGPVSVCVCEACVGRRGAHHPSSSPHLGRVDVGQLRRRAVGRHPEPRLFRSSRCLRPRGGARPAHAAEEGGRRRARGDRPKAAVRARRQRQVGAVQCVQDGGQRFGRDVGDVGPDDGGLGRRGAVGARAQESPPATPLLSASSP